MKSVFMSMFLILVLNTYSLSLRDILISYRDNSLHIQQYELEKDRFHLMVRDAYYNYIAPDMSLNISGLDYDFSREDDGSWVSSRNESLSLRYYQNLPYNFSIRNDFIYNTSEDYADSYNITLSRGFTRQNPHYLNYLSSKIQYDINYNSIRNKINSDVLRISNLYFNYQMNTALYNLNKSLIENQKTLLNLYEEIGIDDLNAYINYKRTESSIRENETRLKEIEFELKDIKNEIILYGNKSFEDIEPLFLYELVEFHDIDINNISLQNLELQIQLHEKALSDFKNANRMDIRINSSYDYQDYMTSMHNFNVWIGVEIPIFTRNRYRENIYKKEIRIKRYEREIFESDLKLRINSLIDDYYLLRDIIEVRSDDVSDAEEILDIARELLSYGNMSYFEFQNIERDYATKTQSLENSIIRANIMAINILNLKEEDLLNTLIKLLE